jgi:hypothetical protein
MAAVSGGSAGLVASHQGALVSPGEQLQTISSLFLLHKAPMTHWVTTENHTISTKQYDQFDFFGRN